MDLYHHSCPPFTRWVLDNDLLQEKFVVIDIGCQGGEHPRWALLRDMVEFHGFDPISEAIDALRREDRPGRNYYEFALGAEDGEQEFFVSNNSFSSSFFGAGTEEINGYPEIARGARTVPLRRLDTLFAAGNLPLADYIKLDCEGFEPYVLSGGREYLKSSGPLCVTTETGFGISPAFPRTHFQAVNEILVEHRLLVFDVNIVRAARKSYVAARAERPLAEPDPLTAIPHLDVGSPGTLDVVFCRDFVAESANPKSYSFSQVPEAGLSVDSLIKAIINFELHGLMDCAFDLAVHFRERLQSRFNVDKATELLLERAPHARNTADVVNCLKMIAQLRSTLLSSALYRNLPNTSEPRSAAKVEAKALGLPSGDPSGNRRSAFAQAIVDALKSSNSGEKGICSKVEAGQRASDRGPAAEKAPLRNELDDARDEIRRLKIKLEEVPPIDYQALMEHIGKQHAFSASDPAFYALYERTKSFTMTSIEAMYALYKAAEYITRAKIPGDIVECGVWQGGSMMLAALTLLGLGDSGRRLVLFDTFAGHPRPDPIKDAQANYDEWVRRRRTEESSDWAAVSLDDVKKNLECTGYPLEKIVLIKGVVENTIVPNRPETIALLRLDTDWYSSTAHELKYLYPRLADRGGILLIDDYGAMPGARQAVDEYFHDRCNAPLLNRIDFSGRIGVKLHPVPDPA